jgi:DNA-binding transcriptional LysR family regulator
MTTALGMVACGLGVTACPSYSASLVHARGLVLRPLTAPEVFRHVNAFTLSKRSLSPAAESFVSFVAEFASGSSGANRRVRAGVARV